MSKEKRYDLLPTINQIEEERQRLRYRKKYIKALRGTINSLIIVAAIAALVALFFLPVMQATGNSMSPTIEENDILLLLKTDSFQSGDLCCFSWNNETLIKRVICSEGDWINIDSAGNVSVNGQLLEESYVSEKSLGECDITLPYQIPSGCVFVMGDHRDTSIDSRNTVIGSVDKQKIIGKICFRLWPFNRFGVLR